MKKVSDEIYNSLRLRNDLVGEWKGSFWDGGLFVISDNGKFTVKEPDNTRESGVIWVNLHDGSYNIKKEDIINHPTADHYAKHTSENGL